MYKKIKHYIKEIIIFIVVMSVVANGLSLYRSGDLKQEKFHISNITLLDGISYTPITNKPLLVHFWATWCPTCSMEASNIQKISQYYEVLTIAVKSGDDTKIKNYLKKHTLNFKVINDKDAFIAHEFKVSAYPTTFIYNKDKELVFTDVGYTTTFGLWLRMWWAGL